MAQKSVVEATYTAYMDYFPDSKEIECITYVLQNPTDTGEFYCVSQEQLLEEYKLAIRRGILSLWQHGELSQVLRASNATSLAEALTSHIVPSRKWGSDNTISFFFFLNLPVGYFGRNN